MDMDTRGIKATAIKGMATKVIVNVIEGIDVRGLVTECLAIMDMVIGCPEHSVWDTELYLLYRLQILHRSVKLHFTYAA